MKITVNKARRAFCAVGVGLLMTATAAAAEPRAFAAISLVADELRMVGQEVVTGSALNNNPVETLSVGFDLIELQSLSALADAILKADAVATVAPVKLTEPRYYATRMDSEQGARASLPEDLVSMLRKGKVSHLVLLTKHRSEARMNTGINLLGTGYVEGLGFYVDRDTPLRQSGTSEVAKGFLAPYVYVRFSLIDVATLAVLRTEVVSDGRVLTAHGTKVGGDPWQILSPAEKVETLRRMVRAQTEAVVPRLLAGLQ